MNYWEDPNYWREFRYDAWGRHCIYFGGPQAHATMGGWTPPYSWGWVMDDFGTLTKSTTNIHYGIYEARHDCH